MYTARFVDAQCAFGRSPWRRPLQYARPGTKLDSVCPRACRGDPCVPPEPEPEPSPAPYPEPEPWWEGVSWNVSVGDDAVTVRRHDADAGWEHSLALRCFAGACPRSAIDSARRRARASPLQIRVIGSMVRGMSKLNCTTHGSPQPCVVQFFGWFMPCAVELMSGILHWTTLRCPPPPPVPPTTKKNMAPGRRELTFPAPSRARLRSRRGI